tara:strand:+ start:2808 stop:3263 length:456 start_codon:yes stop_codon:yes gene_type:complete
MNKLKVKCPKCNDNARFYRQRNRKAGSDFPNDLILECYTCGFRSYSKVAFATIEKYRIAEEERQLAISAELKIKKAKETKRINLEAKLAKEAKRVAKVKKLSEEREIAKILAEYCKWKECDKSRRINSIYCSTTCSNKNARDRYNKRLAAV